MWPVVLEHYYSSSAAASNDTFTGIARIHLSYLLLPLPPLSLPPLFISHIVALHNLQAKHTLSYLYFNAIIEDGAKT
jgi:hypothetical protein